MNRFAVFRAILAASLCAAASLALAAEENLEPRVSTSTAASAPAATDTAVIKPDAKSGTVTATPPPGTVTRSSAVSNARGGARVLDRVELENTQITGNRELPRVMYVVPWKKPDLGDFGGRPAKSLLDELLQPLDRDVFKRQVRYYDALQPDAAAAVAPAVARDEK
jgi:hypothetical protein